jgi:hypothetical protein
MKEVGKVLSEARSSLAAVLEAEGVQARMDGWCNSPTAKCGEKLSVSLRAEQILPSLLWACVPLSNAESSTGSNKKQNTCTRDTELKVVLQMALKESEEKRSQQLKTEAAIEGETSVAVKAEGKLRGGLDKVEKTLATVGADLNFLKIKAGKLEGAQHDQAASEATEENAVRKRIDGAIKDVAALKKAEAGNEVAVKKVAGKAAGFNGEVAAAEKAAEGEASRDVMTAEAGQQAALKLAQEEAAAAHKESIHTVSALAHGVSKLMAQVKADESLVQRAAAPEHFELELTTGRAGVVKAVTALPEASSAAITQHRSMQQTDAIKPALAPAPVVAAAPSPPPVHALAPPSSTAKAHAKPTAVKPVSPPPVPSALKNVGDQAHAKSNASPRPEVNFFATARLVPSILYESFVWLAHGQSLKGDVMLKGGGDGLPGTESGSGGKPRSKPKGAWGWGVC